MGGDLGPFAEAQFLDGTLRHQGNQREAAVNNNTHMGAGWHHALYPAGQTVESARGARLGRPREERHVLGPEAEPHPLAGLGGLRHLERLPAGLEHR